MKYLCPLFFLIFGFSSAPAQETLFDLLENSAQIPNGFETIFDLDVAKYYQLSGNYSGEPRRSEFRKTEWYKTKLAALMAIRDSMLTTKYNVHLTLRFRDNNYDSKRKGFDITLGTNVETPGEPLKAPRSVYGFLFSSLPSSLEPSPGFREGVYTEKLFLPMTLEHGREIESSPEYADVFFFFTPSTREKTTFRYLNADNKWRKATTNNMKSDTVRVVVGNTATGAIYYDKTFNTPVVVDNKKQ